MEVHLVDVTTAFLNGELEDVLYMKQPVGFEEKGQEGLVCKLKKSRYGLKQAPHVWFKRLKKDLKMLGFKVTEAAECLFVASCALGRCLFLVNVVEVLLMSKSLRMLIQVKRKLYFDL